MQGCYWLFDTCTCYGILYSPIAGSCGTRRKANIEKHFRGFHQDCDRPQLLDRKLAYKRHHVLVNSVVIVSL